MLATSPTQKQHQQQQHPHGASYTRARLYKALGCVLLVLIALQYLSGAIDRKSIDIRFFAAAATASAAAAATATRSPPQPLAYREPGGSSPVVVGDDDGRVAAVSLPASPLPRVATNESCPAMPPKLLGPIAVSKSAPALPAMERAFARVRRGGAYAPSECAARWRVAVVVPFRDRFPHLMTLLYNLHPLLQRQQLDYRVFVVEQEPGWPFNRASLMNVGYVEALKLRPEFDCFVFHDVDLLPEDDRNLYHCPREPRHMSVAVDKFRYRLPYADIFGGVSAMSAAHFRLVNGFSNVFWGWGGEDDDMANRIKAKGLRIARYPASVARYAMLVHKKEKPNPQRYEFLKSGKKRYETDGLSNLKYEIIDQKEPKLYTWYLVRLTPPSKPS